MRWYATFIDTEVRNNVSSSFCKGFIFRSKESLWFRSWIAALKRITHRLFGHKVYSQKSVHTSPYSSEYFVWSTTPPVVFIPFPLNLSTFLMHERSERYILERRPIYDITHNPASTQTVHYEWCTMWIVKLVRKFWPVPGSRPRIWGQASSTTKRPWHIPGNDTFKMASSMISKMRSSARTPVSSIFCEMRDYTVKLGYIGLVYIG